MPEQILQECADILKKKNEDYNTGFSRDEYALFGRISHMQSIHTKYMRLRSIIDKPECHINYESLEDTLKDLINYAAIWADWERRHANK